MPPACFVTASRLFLPFEARSQLSSSISRSARNVSEVSGPEGRVVAIVVTVEDIEELRTQRHDIPSIRPEARLLEKTGVFVGSRPAAPIAKQGRTVAKLPISRI